MDNKQKGYITGTTKIPRLHLPDGTKINIRLVAWESGFVSWEEIDD
jgi:hypothetical protein